MHYFDNFPKVSLNGGGISDSTKLVFNKYGDQYFLSQNLDGT